MHWFGYAIIGCTGGMLVWTLWAVHRNRIAAAVWSANFTFMLCSRELENWLDVVRRNPAVFRQRRTYETVWDYAKYAHDEITGSPETSVWKAFVTFSAVIKDITVRLYWYSIEVDGVVHRGGYLIHDQFKTPLTLCLPTDARPPDSLKEHPICKGPIVTCFQCLQIR